MATPTYDLIETVTLTSSGSVTFTSIDGSYRDLILVCEFVAPNTWAVPSKLVVNSDTGSNYSRTYMYGNNTNYNAGTQTGLTSLPLYLLSAAQEDQRQLVTVDIMDYSNTSKHKSVIMRAGNAYRKALDFAVMKWASTSAITSLEVGGTVGQPTAAGSTFSLFGVVA